MSTPYSSPSSPPSPSEAALSISRLTVPNLLLSILSLSTCWGYMPTILFTFIGALLSFAAVETVGIGVPASHDPAVTSGDNVLRVLKSGSCCCGGAPGNHAKSLFIVAAVFTAMGFLFNAIAAAAWLPCSKGGYFDDDYDGYNGGYCR